ncbi:hypothetical protein GUJ93_ZPchr0585g33754 [Zizania palustris]|uniref:Glycoside hydrolase family 13 N-terminal domain-containing protein n=1 Tax=Zizania palustris TaxID=103762 RepID=A0A8J5RKF3_ZIZPA|nr:hypothetical protein GUJ93_ZPchr0585g33754 [Zizania palustris]
MALASLPAPPTPLGSCPLGGGVVQLPRRAIRRPGGLGRAARSCYRFRTDDDGVVDVAVSGKDGDGSGGYAVSVEVPHLPGARGRDGGLVLRATGSGEGVPLAPASGGACLAAELSFDAPRSPFYLSFLLTDAAGSEIRTHRKTTFRVPVGVGPGSPVPLGLSHSGDGAVNFAVYSKSANAVALYLYSGDGDGDGDEPALEIDLDPHIHRTGNTWHVSLESVEGYASYGFCCGGIRRPLLDPYAKVIGDFVSGSSVHDEGITVPSMRCLASLADVPSYNWGRDRHPCLPLEKLAVYRANVALFTKDKSSGLPDSIAGVGEVTSFREGFLKLENIHWYGSNLSEPGWDDLTAISLHAHKCREGSMWVRLVDTSLHFQVSFTESNLKALQVPGLSSYNVEAHTCVLFESKSTLA